ncbi:MAG: radical SAM protein [Clostridia bacterium]|nr:radical SAM protein [Clostridia bacterium]
MIHSFETLSHSVQRKVAAGLVDNILNKNAQEREDLFLRVLDMAKVFWGDRLTEEQYAVVAAEICKPDSRWMNIINHALNELHPNVIKTTFLNLGYEAFFRGSREIKKNRRIYNCNIPWLILFDPTSACNMHCAGCWAGTYGDRHQLSFEDMDKIVTEGKQLGIYLYMMTGGEPLVRKKDILRLAEKHSDVQFAVYTNATLIDDMFCEEVTRVGNIAFFLSVEGDEHANDSRRGDGHYQTVMQAMKLLKKHGILFGISVCYTSQNIKAVTSDEFLTDLSQKGAKFGFYFHYMPIGTDAVVQLLPTPEQRSYIIDRFAHIRSPKSNIAFFPIDFQNDGKYVGGCIAGGRNYFHINAAGDAEPCVFIHYSNANIHSSSLLDILQSPLFMAYHRNQPFNENHLLPCPMLENPEALKEMVTQTKAKNTDFASPESVEHLCEKCHVYADQWFPTAERLWNEQKTKYD